jgi:hypothetical protein
MTAATLLLVAHYKENSVIRHAAKMTCRQGSVNSTLIAHYSSLVALLDRPADEMPAGLGCFTSHQ